MVSTLKIQSVIGNSTRVLFLAYIFGVELTLVQLATFTVTVLLISLATVGVPNGGGSFRSLPAYVAVGIPIEGLVLLQAVKDLKDYLSTIANTTGQFAAATILSRGDRAELAADAAGASVGPEERNASPSGRGWIEAPSL
jgi:Na+/H+-dicarboxylate symporter